MVRTVGRIEQEIAALDRAVATIAQEFYDTYRQYLVALGQAVSQQLILASYHLCTRGYPERFLKLSLSQRQQVQQGLRQLAKQARNQLLERLKPVDSTPSPATSLPNTANLLANISGSADQTASHQNAANEELVILEEIAIAEDGEKANYEDFAERVEGDEPVAREELETRSDSSFSSASPPADSHEASQNSLDFQPIQPKHLARWQEVLEEGIVEELQNLSHAANRLLQQAEVLPGRLPEPVLEVAAKADIATEATASPPNLLNLLIETENEEDKESTMTQFMAIRLRLSEIEFSDSSTTLWRSKIRDLSAQLVKLGREYHKKQKERAIAEAEAAWRSSWYED